MANNSFNLTVLGTGNMAEAIIAGLVSKKIIPSSSITGFDISPTRLSFMKMKYGFATAKNIGEAVSKGDVILLSVKPQQMKDLLTTIKPSLKKNALILSIAAGLDTAFFEKHLGAKAKIIRLMPNTPAMIGCGATAFFANSNASATDKKITRVIFESTGLVDEVEKESLLDVITGTSGSLPAFVYSFAAPIIAAGVKGGLSEETSKRFVLQTMIGAAKLMEASKDDAQTLIAKVASKGGTTEAGLKVLQKRKFAVILSQTIQAAVKRAAGLRKLLS